jgi:hypothetical protein
MVYLAFDLDGTLGNFIIMWRILCNLKQTEFFHLNPQKAAALPDENMTWELGISYTSLVKRIADAEMGKKPLGIFRPGIFKLFKTIVKLKAEKKVQGVIMYTNNGSLPLVNFVRDVFHYAVKYPVFDGIFYFHHALRTKDVFGKPSPSKNWTELKRLFNNIGAPDLEPKDVMFFDDQIHQHLTAILGPNYIKVLPYDYIVPHERVLEIYHKALKDSDLLSTMSKSDFFNYVKSCTHNHVVSNIEGHLQELTDEKRVPNESIPTNNIMSSSFMNDAIRIAVKNHNNNNNNNTNNNTNNINNTNNTKLGGKRKTRRNSKNLAVWTRY